MPRLLVVHHSPTRAVRTLTEAVLAGTHEEAIEGVEVVVLEALDFARGTAGPDDLLAADGYLLGTTANFGSMSGALKHVFDSTFLQLGGALGADGTAGVSPTGSTAGASTTASTDGATAGATDGATAGATARRPFGLWVHGRYDTTGAVRSVLSIVGALGWRQGFEVLEVTGDVDGPARDAAHDLGATIAALVAEG